MPLMDDQHDKLCARIVKLRTNMEQQKKLLRKLEHNTSLAQRQLNTMFDPMACLPLKISSEIFLKCLASSGCGTGSHPEPGALRLPMLLLNICHAWTDIALATPSLWAAIHIIFQGIFLHACGLKELVPIWLHRAQNCQLSITISGTNFNTDVLSIVWRHAQQLKHLELCERKSKEFVSCDLTIQLWKGPRGPGPLPSLKTLAVRGRQYGWGLSPAHILKVLCLAPNLISSRFCDIMEINFDGKAMGHKSLIILQLRRLTFGKRGTYYRVDYSQGILDRLSLPRLEVLRGAEMHGTRDDSLLRFLQRSSPPLHELVVAGPGDYVLLGTCLQLVPRLCRFEMWRSGWLAVEGLFAALAKSPPMLPQLNTLIIHVSGPDPTCRGSTLSAPIPNYFWTATLCMLTARQTHFQVFHLEEPDGLLPSTMPLDIAAAFEELVAHGMKICIDDSGGQWEYMFN
ncbi:hypothetical protein B0H14DRAFT_3612457 [Mycena olivaceomarginata]|nr:hypothetical protein B0H14DRAFT_3612457 [Mycena olivaceomarginata]